MTRSRVLGGTAAAAAVLALCTAPAARAVLPSDIDNDKTTVSLPAPSKHWVWVNDMVFTHMSDGMAHLVDGDSGKYLGMLSTGYSARIVLPRDGKVVYSPETYFSRGTRGTRTDVVTIYDAATLQPKGEVALPAKRASGMPVIGMANLTDDDRFLLIYNFTPSQSVSVVDTASKTFVGEIETAGCAFVLPTGPRSFFSICGDGGLLATELDGSGRAASQARTAPLFDVAHDPVTEKPVRLGDTWYFVSFDGRIVPVKAGPKGLSLGESWSLTTPAERAAGWRPGGLQQLAVHGGTSRLYAIMHRGKVDTHKDPGKDIWVYDLKTHKRVQTIVTSTPTSSIQVSSDDHPLLYGAFAESGVLDIYDAQSGKLLRSVKSVGSTPTMLLTP